MPSRLTWATSGPRPSGNLPASGHQSPSAARSMVAAVEPAVVHHKEFHAHLRRDLGHGDLRLLVHVEEDRLPGVVEHRVKLLAVGQQVVAHMVVQGARGCAETARRVAGQAGGVVKVRPGSSRQAKSQSLSPMPMRVEPKSVTSAASFQLPLHASTPNQTSPCTSSAPPRSTANQGLAWWLVVMRRLSLDLDAGRPALPAAAATRPASAPSGATADSLRPRADARARTRRVPASPARRRGW
jgi:hypothetical protein